MRFGVKRGIGLILALVGVVLILNSNGITGFAILEDVSRGVGSVFGITLVVVGALIFLTREDEWDRYRVERVVKEYDQGVIGPIEAASKINRTLFPGGIRINGVEYHGGKKNETIRTERGNIPVKLSTAKKAEELAYGFYEVARVNDPANVKNCELHISSTASSKHHVPGLMKLIDRFETQHKDEMKDLGAA